MGLSARVAGATAPRLRAQLTPYALLAPAVLLLGLIVLYPVIRAVGLSFYHYSIQDIKNVEFIGLGNYIELFTDDTLFWDAGRRSITWVGANVVFQLTLGMAFALVLNEDFRGRALMRGLLPVALGDAKYSRRPDVGLHVGQSVRHYQRDSSRPEHR